MGTRESWRAEMLATAMANMVMAKHAMAEALFALPRGRVDEPEPAVFGLVREANDAVDAALDAATAMRGAV